MPLLNDVKLLVTHLLPPCFVGCDTRDRLEDRPHMVVSTEIVRNFVHGTRGDYADLHQALSKASRRFVIKGVAGCL